jgi:hypothetical protein
MLPSLTVSTVRTFANFNVPGADALGPNLDLAAPLGVELEG